MKFRKKPVAIVIWMLTWRALSFTPTGCPQPPFEPDPYTGVFPLITDQTAQLCYERNDIQMQREFETKADAEAFKAGCPEGTCSVWTLTEYVGEDRTRVTKP